jgi:AraC-like DNA-binding protein
LGGSATTGLREDRKWSATYPPGEPDWSRVRRAPSWIPEGILRGPIPEPGAFFRRFEAHCGLYNTDADGRLIAGRGLALDLLLRLFAAGRARSGTPRQTASPELVQELLLELAQAPFHEAESIAATLESFGQSYDHQARVFRRTYGLTPLQYVNSVRGERAKDLLARDDLSIEEVAYRLGFLDPAYFHRFFRRVTGMTPGEYRRRPGREPP